MAQEPKQEKKPIKSGIGISIKPLLGIKPEAPKVAPKVTKPAPKKAPAPKVEEKKVAPKVEEKKVAPKVEAKKVEAAPKKTEKPLSNDEVTQKLGEESYSGRTPLTYKKLGTHDQMMEAQMIERASSIRNNKGFPEDMKAARSKYIKQGFFTEKDGDLMPTDKYYEYKKSGKLSSAGLK